MGGDLVAESAGPGLGACFRLTLPCVDRVSEDASTSGSASSGASSSPSPPSPRSASGPGRPALGASHAMSMPAMPRIAEAPPRAAEALQRSPSAPAAVSHGPALKRCVEAPLLPHAAPPGSAEPPTPLPLTHALASPPAASPVSTLSRSAAVAPHRMRSAPLSVLVAEDNRLSQVVIRTMLTQRGCAVTLADDGQRAVEEFRRGAFDLVLMDMWMPNLDGLAATRLILQDQAARGIRVPVVALTASVSVEERAASAAAGCALHIGKPISSALVDVLDDLVESSRLGAV